MIEKLKSISRSRSDILKNLHIRLEVLKGNHKLDCFYSCKWYSVYLKMSEVERLIELSNLCVAIIDIKYEINCIGKVILLIRGNNWRI